jgi:hypothetical protein
MRVHRAFDAADSGFEIEWFHNANGAGGIGMILDCHRLSPAIFGAVDYREMRNVSGFELSPCFD